MRVEINVVTPAVAVSLLYSASSMVATLRPYLPLRRHPHRFLRRPLAHVIRRSQPGPRPRPRDAPPATQSARRSARPCAPSCAPWGWRAAVCRIPTTWRAACRAWPSTRPRSPPPAWPAWPSSAAAPAGPPPSPHSQRPASRPPSRPRDRWLPAPPARPGCAGAARAPRRPTPAAPPSRVQPSALPLVAQHHRLAAPAVRVQHRLDLVDLAVDGQPVRLDAQRPIAQPALIRRLRLDLLSPRREPPPGLAHQRRQFAPHGRHRRRVGPVLRRLAVGVLHLRRIENPHPFPQLSGSHPVPRCHSERSEESPCSALRLLVQTVLRHRTM